MCVYVYELWSEFRVFAYHFLARAFDMQGLMFIVTAWYSSARFGC